MRLTLRKKFSDMLAASMVAAEKRTLRMSKDVATFALAYAATTSPQYSGTFASNWRLSINSPKPGLSRAGLSRGQEALSDPFQEGDSLAVGKAVNSSGSKLSQLRLGDRVFLSTSATNDEGEQYSFDIEQGVMRFRSVNPSGGKVLERTQQQLKVQFAGALK